MAENKQTVTSGRPQEPVIRHIGFNDLVDALAAGLRDFQAYPTFGLFFGAIYTAGGLVILGCALLWDLIYLVYPLAAGFALIGPFVAVGLYEVSRFRERGEKPSWRAVFSAILTQGGKEISWMAFVTVFIFIIWMYQVRLLIALFFGLHGLPAGSSFPGVFFSTPEGLAFLAVGHVIGAVLATVTFSITVVSFPLLLDREVDFITAMITSFRSVVSNPVPMLGWALCVAVLLFIAALPMFLGMLVVLPVLGYTTWHLYRKLVA
ncbi:hypothetical protein DC522_16295 [Microvirga sp. KLBC 81]|uniref:DUF2189 domain-containing protein n=1 Tax=Microvirga sp. KLBC 81 TaxID=1862707 RepID=UPI000D5135FE|nr:DUF2189 domain-containing protein [Microvirga sp. KLBC 81]PVE23298.1 hypothetical protein DC522_16295 [Microvirga sp. KLBC 81]